MSEGAAGGQILVVDDYEEVRELTVEVLAGAGYAVVAVGDASAALAEVKRTGSQIRLLVTDLNLGGMSGIELAQEVRRLRPGLPVLYISGEAAGSIIQPDELILKP